MRPSVRIIAISIAMAGMAIFAAQPEHTGTHRPTKTEYVKHTFGTSAVVRSAAGAAIGQAHNSPHEWGGGIKGFGKRFGSAFGTHVVKNSIQYTVAAARHEELGYRPSGKHGVFPRLGYALESTVITHKTTNGRRTVATGEIAGAVGSGLISRAWQPASARSLAAGAGSAGITLGADAGLNVVKEFWPRHPAKPAQARTRTGASRSFAR